jgi:hypothetical protein
MIHLKGKFNLKLDNMRKVVVKEEYIDNYYGYFHQWGTSSNGEQFLSCAIIEDLYGRIHCPRPYDVTFIEEFPEEKPVMP